MMMFIHWDLLSIAKAFVVQVAEMILSWLVSITAFAVAANAFNNHKLRGSDWQPPVECSYDVAADANYIPGENLENYVNILGGTDSRYDLSRGSTLPLIARPWGFDTFAPQTDDDATWPGWWFHPSDRRFFGLRLTHQPSPWIQDYGNFLLKAYMPSDAYDPSASRDVFTSYSPVHATFSPHYFSARLNTYSTSMANLQIEFSPVRHGGIMRATFPAFVAQEKGDDESQALAVSRQLRRVGITLPIKSDQLELIESPIDGAAMITGYSSHNSGGVGKSAFQHHFVLAIYSGSRGSDPVPLISALNSSHAGNGQAWFDFSPLESIHDTLTVRMSTSFISRDQAIESLQLELPLNRSFDDVALEARNEWRAVLSRYQVREAPPNYSQCELQSLYTVLYSSLYRASLFPRQLSEFSAVDGQRHWSPYASDDNDRVRTGPLSADSGFWDAWNTVYPLMSLIHRHVLAETLRGWQNAFNEGSWLPQWASPGFRGSMVGTMSDVSLADAIVKELPGIDAEGLYAAIRKNAFDIPPAGSEAGRACMKSYLSLGYVPVDECSESVARTLNYWQSDYAAAQAAQKLGHSSDYLALTSRLQNISVLFDQETAFFRGKHANGKWNTPFDQYAWGGDYTEGGPWQFRFYLPFDVNSLSNLYSSSGKDLCTELQAAQTSEPTVHIGGYSSVIHEQTELFERCWGQYAHNNQPSHHMLYMFLGGEVQTECSTKGRGWIRKALRELYRPGSDMFPGDEDNGEMGAWFALSALGLYTRSPGSEFVELGSPLFGAVEIDVSDHQYLYSGPRKVLRVEAVDNSPENIYVLSASLNGSPLSLKSNSIDYSKLMEGGVLSLKMGRSPFD